MKSELKDKTSKEKNIFNRDNIKIYGFKRFLASVKYSLEGLYHAYRYEQSLWIHGACTILAVTLGLLFKIKLWEWAILFIALGSILALELINTAIEATVDLATEEVKPLAKIAKDCGSAASFIMSIVSFVISLFVFAPYLKEIIVFL